MGVRLYFHFYFYSIIHIYLSKIHLPIYMFLYSLMSFTFFPMYAKMNHSLRQKQSHQRSDVADSKALEHRKDRLRQVKLFQPLVSCEASFAVGVLWGSPWLGVKCQNSPGFPEHQGRAVEGLNLVPRLYGYMIPWADFLDLGHHLDANNVQCPHFKRQDITSSRKLEFPQLMERTYHTMFYTVMQFHMYIQIQYQIGVFFSQDESLFVVCRHVHSCQELCPAVMIAQKGVCMGIDQSALTWPLATKHHLNIQGSAETMF